MSQYQTNLVRTLEELSLNALPCLQQILNDGWVLRFAEGFTKRANSVTPLYPGYDNLEVKISRCEAAYRRLDLQPIFRLADTPQNAAIDLTLERLGYLKQDSVSVRLREIGDRNLDRACDVTIESELSTSWLDGYVHGANLPSQYWDTISTMLEIIPHPTCYASVKDRHRFCSWGLGVLERDYLGIFFLVTTRKQRRRGYASQLVNEMMHWGSLNGATKVYLQVETANHVGIDLYNKLKFREIYQYFYRLKP